MFSGEEDSSFQTLPPEMIVEILRFVDLRGKKNARMICRRWRWILDHRDSGLICFKEKSETTEESIKCLLKSHLHIEILKLYRFKMTWPSMTYSRNKFPPIRKIELYSGHCEQTVIMILQYGSTRTESLTLGEYCFGHVRPDILARTLPEIKFNQLTKLILEVESKVTESHIIKDEWESKQMKSFIKCHKNHTGGILQILMKATVPNLKILRFELGSYEETEISVGIVKVLSEFMTFIERHSITLKRLGLRICLNSHDRRSRCILSSFPHIPAPFYSAEQQETCAQNLKLECLDISATHVDTLIHLVSPCVWKSDMLTKLIWYPIEDIPWFPVTRLMQKPDTFQPIQSVIQRNRNTLTDVTMTFTNGDIAVDPFHISYLESCPALTQVTIQNMHKILNIQLQLPQVRKLVIVDTGRISINIISIKDLTTWITRSFRNLEIVHISTRLNSEQNWKFDWVQALLVFGLKFLFRHSHFNVPTLIRQFCDNNPKLILKMERETEHPGRRAIQSQSCVIKILPLPNAN